MLAYPRRRVGVIAAFAVLLLLSVLTISTAGAEPYTSNGVTTEATVDPAEAEPGDTVAIEVSATSQPATPRATLTVEVFAPDNSEVFEHSVDRLVLNRGRPQGFTVDWEIASDAAPGTYAVRVSVFDRNGVLVHWNQDAAFVTVGDDPSGPPPPLPPYEVWTTIQGTHEIHVLAPRDGQGDDMEVVDVIDYKQLTAPGGPWAGYDMRNPHMVLFGLHGNPGSDYAYVSNVSSANTTIINATTREVVSVLPTGTRTHAVQPAPDGSRAMVAAIGTDGFDGCREQFTAPCGQIAEILIDNGDFSVGRTYNFSDFPEGSGWEGLPRFDPICASFTPDSRYVYVTLWSGGLVVFEINENQSEPLFDVVRVFPSGTGRGEVAPNGCGIGYSTDGRLMFANSATPQESYYYTFNLRTHRMIRSVDVSDTVQDVHGMMLSPRGDEVVMVGRLSDNFIVLNQRSGSLKRHRTFDLQLGGAYASNWSQTQQQLRESTQTITNRTDPASGFYCAIDVPLDSPSAGSGTQAINFFQQTVDPAPDLVDFSPDGKYIYVTLRGPNPSTGTHEIAGYPPGVVVIDFDTGLTVQVIELPGNQQAQDPHGIAVRRIAGQ